MTKEKKTLSNVILTAGRPNANGHIYPRDMLEKAVAAAQKRIEEGGPWLGEMNSYEPKVRLGAVSHQITDISMEGDEVTCTAKVLDTEAGEVLKMLLKDGDPQLTPVGYGDVTGDRVITGYSISQIHVDARSRPSDDSIDNATPSKQNDDTDN